MKESAHIVFHWVVMLLVLQQSSEWCDSASNRSDNIQDVVVNYLGRTCLSSVWVKDLPNT